MAWKYNGDESRTEESPRWLGSTMYEITVNRKHARTPISLKSVPIPLKFSENLQAHPKTTGLGP